MHKKQLLSLSIILWIGFVLNAQTSKGRGITTDDADEEVLKNWDVAEQAFQALHFEEAFKVLQKLIRIPSIASNLENEKIFGEKLVVHEEYPLEGKRVSFRQKALQRLSKLSVEELELYQTIYE